MWYDFHSLWSHYLINFCKNILNSVYSLYVLFNQFKNKILSVRYQLIFFASLPT